jgi:hypothetical protein
MDKITLRKFLSKYLIYHYKIKHIYKQIAEQKIKAENTVRAVTYDKEKTAPTNKITDPNEAIDEYLDNEKQYTKILNDYKELNKYIYDQISKLNNPNYKHLLHNIYVKYIPFYQLKKQYKPQSQIYVDYENAINELSKVFILNENVEKLLPF